MKRTSQIFSIAFQSFASWAKNPRIIIVFALAFVLCFLLSDKAVRFALEYDTTMQIVEAFVWTFGDANSILLSSLLLILLFADMPFINAITPFYLMRTDRKTWIAGQAVYIIIATCIYLLFILFSTSAFCMAQSFAGNMWSETAAMLGYSGAGKEVALPALVKTLELSTPYESMFNIFALMLLYTLLMSFVMLIFNLKRGRAGGITSAFVFSLYGFLLNPETLRIVFQLPDEAVYKANVAVGWMSPLNHATYHMHNFGYDLLPRLWHTYLIFSVLIFVLFYLSVKAARRYNFMFTGTEN